MTRIKGLIAAGHLKEAREASRALVEDPATSRMPAGIQSDVLQLAGRSAYEVGEYDATLMLDGRALDLALVSKGDASQSTASIRTDLGVALRHLGRLDEAETAFSKALSTFSAAAAPDQALMAETLIDYAILAHDRGDLPKAERLTANALVRRRLLKPADPAAVAQALDNYGTILQEEGRLSASRAPIGEALAIRKRSLPPEHPDIAASLNNLAVLEQARGEFSQAEQHLREAVSIDRRVFGDGDPQVLQDLSNLGEVLRSMDRPDEALELETKVLAGRERRAAELGQRPDGALDLAVSHGNVGNLLRDLGRDGEAGPHYALALALDRARAGDAPTNDVALDLANIGEALRQTGDAVRASAAFEEGLKVVDRVGDPALRTKGALLHNLGTLLRGTGDLAKAELYLRRAVELRARILPANHPELAASEARLASILSQRGSAEAIPTARFALKMLLDRSGRGTIGLSAAAEAAEARAARRTIDDVLATFAGMRPNGSILPGEADDDVLAAMQIAQDTGTAVVAARTASAAFSSDARVAAVLRDIEDLRDQRDAAAEREARAAGGVDKARIDVSAPPSRELDERLSRLIATIPASALGIDRQPRLRFADLAHRLAPDEGWVGIATGENATAVVLVTAGGVRLSLAATGRKALHDQVASLRKGLDPSVLAPFDVSASHTLYEALFGKLGSAFEDVVRLTVASDGPLESLPLSVLVADDTASTLGMDSSYASAAWLSDRKTITLTPSFAVALATAGPRRGGANGSAFMGFGDPALGPPLKADRDATAATLSKLMFLQGTTEAVADVRSLPSLPETADQLAAMNALFAAGHGRLLTGAAATKVAVKGADLRSVRVLAFATHGLLASESLTGEPALVLTPSSQADDGLLTTTDIAGLHLDADLVILSACNTAAPLAGYAADGLSGLTRAFFHAGARSVLISHWPIEARATQTLMKLLSLSRGKATSEALNEAERSLRRTPGFEHPAFWAPFELVGRGDVPMVE